MGFIEALKAVFARIAANIVAAVERMSAQDVVVTVDGDIVVREPAVKWLSDKMSAVIIASAAMLFLLSPLQGEKAMAIGDKLIRLATFLWEGANGSVPPTVQEAGN